MNNIDKIKFNHTPKLTIDPPEHHLTWRQTYANKQGFNGIIQVNRWIEAHKTDPETQRKKDYYKQVWEHTEQNAPNVPNIELRGKDYHIDHIIPINYGYTNNIDPAIIGGLDNLQILSMRENFLKAGRYKPKVGDKIGE